MVHILFIGKILGGWERDNVKNTFPLEKYTSGLIHDFYHHDYTTGPLKTFEL